MKPQTLPPALTCFDEMPGAGLVGVRVVAALFGVSVSTVWRRVELGLLPQPHKFGSSTRWKVGEIRQVLATGSGGSTP
ncbi:AlpA family transcriptional regulator [Paraburkholderia sp. BL6665CI2N2]|nr:MULTISPECIES: transcriptional regulator [unclassified Paraburkholderia]RKR46130.1 AlpA family transcriptional regulator [Paraburkholderia sp. BL17N1]TDY26127.1 AlpA family transcriptional regulator [Paraburkholderia sp. BL6665CI2N2]